MSGKKYTANDIQSLDGMEHVRLRPKMYFEEVFQDNNLNSLATEVLCHAFDEYFDGICKNIQLIVGDCFFKVNYDAGMSLELSHGDYRAELIMTKLFACKNEKKHLEVGEEYCRLGIATINGASKKCELITISDNKKGHFIFEKGKTISREVKDLIEYENDFTELTFFPDEEIFGNNKFDYEKLRLRLDSLKLKLPNLNIQINNLK